MNTVNGIRAARQTLGPPQEQLAHAAECSAGYIRLLERGFDPKFSDVLPRVHAVLGINELRPAAATPGAVKTSPAGGDSVKD